MANRGKPKSANCMVDGCEARPIVRGLCRPHYMQHYCKPIKGVRLLPSKSNGKYTGPWTEIDALPLSKSPLLAEQIRDAIERSGGTMSAICRRCQIARGQLYRFLHGERDILIETADKLLAALGCTVTIHQPVVGRKAKK